jgi:hypothetical protein
MDICFLPLQLGHVTRSGSSFLFTTVSFPVGSHASHGTMTCLFPALYETFTGARSRISLAI